MHGISCRENGHVVSENGVSSQQTFDGLSIQYGAIDSEFEDADCSESDWDCFLRSARHGCRFFEKSAKEISTIEL